MPFQVSPQCTVQSEQSKKKTFHFSLFTNHFKVKRGFTLIELLVVISIIGILTSIGTIAYSNAQAKSRDSRRKQDLADIKTASQLFYNDKSYYPCFTASPACSSWQYGGHAPPAGTPIETYLVPTYMQKMPTNPKGINCGYMYGSVPYGKSFTIFAVLENINDPDAKAVKPTPKYTISGNPSDGNTTWTIYEGSCQGTFNYWVNNPD